MIRGMKNLAGRLLPFRRNEDGNTTIEFVFLFPFFITLFLSAYESGVLMLRTIMLDRAVDISVRDLRLGNWANPTHAQFKDQVCDIATIIPDCENTVLVELRPVSKDTWQPLGANPTCVDRDEPIQPVTTFDAGAENEMMLVRACAVFDPMFPGAGLGFRIKELGGTRGYSLVATSAFVNEPRVGG